jgi:UDP-N-acetyl-2-amino-2-deoxyglucuronate dehydrogenase
MKNYAIIGMGYVAEKHLRAIKETGGDLIASLDLRDGVGILDSYFPSCSHFTEFERFDRFCSRNGSVDFVSICSPNYLHDSHVRFSLRIGADVICEKPLVLNERNLDGLAQMEEKYNQKINCILQLRLNEDLIKLRQNIQSGSIRDTNPKLTYHTPRGDWYDYSWKANKEKSGGVVTNIGIHLFDLLFFLFGQPNEYKITSIIANRTVQGFIGYNDTRIDFELSIDKLNEPCRTLQIDKYTYSFTKGFADLHTKSYREILKGNGFGIEDVRASIRICEKLREY